MRSSFGSAEDTKKKVIWAVLFVVIAAASVFAVFTASKDFSFSNLVYHLRRSNPVFIVLAFLAMLIHIASEGMALRVLFRSFGHPVRIDKSIVYSCADLYFSAITPSATGGQPACAYFAIRDGIPASCVTLCLIFNLAMYTLSIIIIGVITMIVFPGVYMYFGIGARILIALGGIILCVIAAFFILTALKGSWADWLGELIIKIGLKLRIIKSPDGWPRVFRAEIINYKHYASMIGQHKDAIVKALLLNILQRGSQFAVTMFMYIALNINVAADKAAVVLGGVKLLGAQSLISMGSTFVPIPGAMGYTDLMMLNGFSSVMPESDAAVLELLSRSTSFYCCVILSFIVVAVNFIVVKKRNSTRP
ncbi:MAG: flippase-like domain-containing protein [Firmicutes bacterium]|nr:flippase-like domain-containing protein [Bacillota bacterium]